MGLFSVHKRGIEKKDFLTKKVFLCPTLCLSYKEYNIP